MSLGQVKGFFYAIVLVAAALLPAASQSPAPPGLSLPQILDKMERHNQLQAQRLKRYKAVRHYEAEADRNSCATKF